MKTCKKTIKGGKRNYKNKNKKNKSRKQKPKKMVKKNIQYRQPTPYPGQQYPHQYQQQYPQQQPQQIEVKDTTGLGRKALNGASTGFGLGLGLQLAESGVNYFSDQ